MSEQEEILRKLLIIQFDPTGNSIIPLSKVRDYLSIICNDFKYYDYLLSDYSRNHDYLLCNSKALDIVKSIYKIHPDESFSRAIIGKNKQKRFAFIRLC